MTTELEFTNCKEFSQKMKEIKEVYNLLSEAGKNEYNEYIKLHSKKATKIILYLNDYIPEEELLK